MDLLLLKIANNDSFFDNADFKKHFINQIKCIISIESLLMKIRELLEKYGEEEKHLFIKSFPVGCLDLINEYTINKFEGEIMKNKLLTEKFKEFYKFILLIPGIEKYTNIIYLYDIITLFDQECTFSDQELSIKRLTGRKKSRNVSSKKDYLEFKTKKKSRFDILEWDPKIIAKQFTLISFNLFAKIEIKEFLNSAWTKKNKMIEAPNIYKLIDRFNLLTFWVIEEILSYDDKFMRAKCIEKFINVALCLKEMNNFNDCINIINGLNNYTVLSLNLTWNSVAQKEKLILNELYNLSSFCKNYSFLRKTMEKSKGKPAIPYLLLFLKDLAFLEESSEYIKNEYLVNILKIKKCGEIIDYFLSFRSNVYLFRNEDELNILRDPRPKSEKELEKISTLLEPEFKLSSKQQKEKRITNTDSRFYYLNPSNNSFLENSDFSSENILKLIKDDHFI